MWSHLLKRSIVLFSEFFGIMPIYLISHWICNIIVDDGFDSRKSKAISWMLSLSSHCEFSLAFCFVTWEYERVRNISKHGSDGARKNDFLKITTTRSARSFSFMIFFFARMLCLSLISRCGLASRETSEIKPFAYTDSGHGDHNSFHSKHACYNAINFQFSLRDSNQRSFCFINIRLNVCHFKHDRDFLMFIS